MEDTEEPADELWKSARQWRDIEPKEKGTKHGQMLLSLEMNVSIVDSLALLVVVEKEKKAFRMFYNFFFFFSTKV